MPSGHEAAAEASPYFFLSYAHSHGLTPTDEYRRDRLVKRFHDDLKDRVRDLARSGTGSLVTSAVDSEIPIGGRWSDRISQGLARCRSFVALYSSEYFSSEHCGKEWRAFANRLDTDLILRGRRPEAIIPVFWRPVSEEAMPKCARELQFTRLNLGPTCRQYGLSYLLRHLQEHRAEYEAAVAQLARQIVHVAERDAPVQAERYPDYLTQDDAFHRPGDPTYQRPRIRIVIAAPTQPRLPRGADPDMYGELPTQWRPYLPNFVGEIALAAKRLAESMDFQVVVETLEHSAELKAGTIPSAPTLLIIDPWAAQVPALQQRLSRFDSSSHLKLWIRPVVAWDRENPANKSNEVDLESRLFSTLSYCRRRYRPDSPQVLDGLETIHDFYNELPAVIRKAERLYFSEVARERSELSQPEEQPHRPRFRGPGPGLGFGLHGSLQAKNPQDEELNDAPPGPPGPPGAAPPAQPRPVLRRYDFPNTEDQP
ncbi:MAG TPA: TIR-like protein FxsC [Actinospica sp.]|jgi:FxsC-like protein|nr:TIR-like protein FxsC [Actinospica sp.]